MMSKTQKVILALYVLVLFIDIYGSFRINVLIEIAFFGFLVLLTGFRGVGRSFLTGIMPLVGIFLVAFLGLFYYREYALGAISKDILHLIRPIIGVLTGYLVMTVVKEFRVFAKALILSGAITAGIHLFSVFFITGISSSITDIRGSIFLDNFLEIFALFFLVFYPWKYSRPLFSKRTVLFIGALLSLSILMYFSRAMVVTLLLMVFAKFGFTRLTRRSIKIIGLFLVGISLFYVYLFSIKLQRNSKGIEGFFYKIKNAPEEITKTKIDRDDHRDLWDHWRGYEAKRAFALLEKKPMAWVFGAGHGSLVNLKFRAPLDGPDGDGMRYISTLHNGYVFVLYKTGLIGLGLLFIFLAWLYRFLYQKEVSTHHRFLLDLISTVGIFYAFTSLIITGIYIPKDTVIFILGGLLYLEQSTRKAYAQTALHSTEAIGS